jgi:hypothetical protein
MANEKQEPKQEKAQEPPLSFPNLKDPETARRLEAQRQHHLNDDGKIKPINQFCPDERCGFPLVLENYADPASRKVCSWDPRHTPAPAKG